MSFRVLEEAQGLTPDDVRGWLLAKGWRAGERRTLAHWWIVPREVSDLVSGIWLPHDDNEDREQFMDGLLRVIARVHGLTPQQLLREMNPRMRAGLPSLAAQEAHSRNGGVWIACHGELGNGGSIVFVSFDLHDNSVAIWDGEEWHDAESEMVADMPNWRFWPCDANGNKVRYPTNEQGEML